MDADPEALSRPFLPSAGLENGQSNETSVSFRRPEGVVLSTPKGLAIVARMLGITNDPSSPGSVITTSQAAFGEYESLEASGPVERLDGRNGLAGDAEEASTSTATMSTTSNTSKDTADTTRTTSTRLNHATAALINTLVGAGIVALPKAFLSLGVLPGVILLLSFYFLSRYTLAAMIRSASTVGVWTYDELVRSQFGSVGAISLDTAIVVNNLGGLLIFLIIIGDLMVGTPPHYSGIVTNAFGMHGGDVWWLSREFVVGAVSFLVLFPLVSLRDISGLGKVSAYSVSVAIGLVGTIGMLAVVAAYEGRLATDVSVWLPNVHVLDDGRRTEDCSILRAAVSFLAILPVIAVPFCCHYNLFPVATNLERFSDRRIAMVIRRSLVVCTALYAVMAVSGVALFGSATEVRTGLSAA